MDLMKLLYKVLKLFSFPNIDEKSNQFRVTLDRTLWHDLTFGVGCYENKDINEERKRESEII